MKIPKGWQVQSKTVARSAPKQKQKKEPSVGERLLSKQLDLLKIPYATEFKFHPKRKWSADFVIEGYPILVEVEGGVFSNGGHTRGSGYTTDCEKYSNAAMLGYYVIRGTTEQVRKGHVLIWIEEMMKFIDETK